MVGEGKFIDSFRTVSAIVFDNARSHGFWSKGRNKAEMIALMHSELSEALESIRKDFDRPDEHCPSFSNVEIELADCIIRIMDFSHGLGLDVGAAVIEKMAFNAGRPHLHGKNF